MCLLFLALKTSDTMTGDKRVGACTPCGPRGLVVPENGGNSLDRRATIADVGQRVTLRASDKRMCSMLVNELVRTVAFV